MFKQGDRVRLIGGEEDDVGYVDVVVPDSEWTVVVRGRYPFRVMAGKAEAFVRAEYGKQPPPWPPSGQPG